MTLNTYTVQTWAPTPHSDDPSDLPNMGVAVRLTLLESVDVPTLGAQPGAVQAIRNEHLAGDFIPFHEWGHCSTITATRWDDTPLYRPTERDALQAALVAA